jgi:hypothetical protein
MHGSAIRNCQSTRVHVPLVYSHGCCLQLLMLASPAPAVEIPVKIPAHVQSSKTTLNNPTEPPSPPLVSPTDTPMAPMLTAGAPNGRPMAPSGMTTHIKCKPKKQKV